MPSVPWIGPRLDQALAQHIGPYIVDAVTLVGVLVGPEHRVDALDLGVEELLANVGRGVDQEGLALILNQDRATGAPVAAVIGVGRAPLRLPRSALPDAARRPTSRSPGWSRARLALHPGALRLGEQPEEIVGRRRLQLGHADAFQLRDLGRVWATKAGSLVLPRLGTGAR